MEDEQRTCGKCGSARTRLIGQSVSPAVIYLQCADCGHTTTVVASAAPPSTMEGREVERLVHGILADFELPFVLLSVVDAADGWDVIVRSYSRRIVRFHLDPAAPSAMQAAIKRALESEQ